MDSTKPHVVIVSYPAQGHINPLIQFAKLLHSSGFHITFVNTEFTHKRLIETNGPGFAKGLSDFQFETVSDGFPDPDDTESRSHAHLVCDSTRKNSVTPFKELLVKLNSSEDVPPVTCVVSDAVLTFPSNAAQELGIPEVQFWTASACGLMGYYLFDELIKRGLIPLKDESCRTNGYLETPLEWVRGMEGIRLKDMPSFCLTTDPNDLMVEITIDQMKTCTRSSATAMIINTIYDLEEQVLKALASDFPPIYTIGPLIQLTNHILPNPEIYSSLELNLWKEDGECIDWLNKREPKSVVYVNFGSIAILSEEEMIEFAIGLENCGFDFIWVLRPNMVKGSETGLGKEFLERIKDRGLILSWCPQEKVLSHPSVGLFVSHAGWNSMLETVSAGVPVICWSHGAEQTTNSRQVCLAWKNGTVIEKNVKGSEIAELVKEMMVSEKGKEKRENASKWKKETEEATSEGGSSFVNFNKLIKEVLLHSN